MAVLVPPASNGHAFADETGGVLVPIGTFVAEVMDIKDEYEVVRQKYDSPDMEKVDLTTFLFRFHDETGAEHKMASKQMRISGHEKSSLFGFLKNLLGHAPQYGWDYLELKGHVCMVSVEHVQRRDGTGVFAAISGLSPLPAGFAAMVPPAAPTPVVAQGRAPAVPQLMPRAALPQPAAGRVQQVAIHRPAPGARPMPSIAPVRQPMTAETADDPLPF